MDLLTSSLGRHTVILPVGQTPVPRTLYTVSCQHPPHSPAGNRHRDPAGSPPHTPAGSPAVNLLPVQPDNLPVNLRPIPLGSLHRSRRVSLLGSHRRTQQSSPPANLPGNQLDSRQRSPAQLRTPSRLRSRLRSRLLFRAGSRPVHLHQRLALSLVFGRPASLAATRLYNHRLNPVMSLHSIPRDSLSVHRALSPHRIRAVYRQRSPPVSRALLHPLSPALLRHDSPV
jgi:hypothetical protein